MYLQIQNITKRYGTFAAVDNVNMDVGAEEFVCLLGPSGCGKTTLLRMVSGLVTPDEGRILLDGRDIRPMPARKRGFGIVFQSYSLFPNMTIGENVAYGLRIRNASAERIRRRVGELLDMVGLAEIEGKYPYQISGGQQQRVALARAIAIDPGLLLLDEPLSALDAKVRLSLREEVRKLQRRLRIPTLMVTHDQDEAMSMADRVVCMNEGRVEQIGTPTELYIQPATPFVATFLGRMNVLEFDGTPAIGGQPLQAAGPVGSSTEPTLYVRPEHIDLVEPGASTEGANAFEAEVADRIFEGNITRYRVRAEHHLIEVEKMGSPTHAEGDRVTVTIPPDALRVIG